MKTYIIDNIEFKLKDLTLNELDEVNNLLSYTNNTVDVQNENSKRFLELVLEPVGRSNKKVDFGKCKESTAVEVLKDFFTRRIKNGSDLKDYFMTLAQNLKKQTSN